MNKGGWFGGLDDLIHGILELLVVTSNGGGLVNCKWSVPQNIPEKIRLRIYFINCPVKNAWTSQKLCWAIFKVRYMKIVCCKDVNLQRQVSYLLILLSGISDLKRDRITDLEKLVNLIYPIGSMHGIFPYIYHKNQPNLGKFILFVSCGFDLWIWVMWAGKSPVMIVAT